MKEITVGQKPPKKIKTIGRYEVRETLGRGSMGSVYKVYMPVIENVAALKLLSPTPKLIEKMGHDWVRKQFINEASLMAGIRHPHVATVHSFDETNDQPFYLMEYFCMNLGTLIRETYWSDGVSRIVPVQNAIKYTTQILDGLVRLHEAGIIHRDIKPFNIMLSDYDDVKIADFGLSKKRGEASPTLKDSSIPSLFIGTRHYASPEQEASPEAIDHRSDLYSMGVLLYRMLTGKLPQKETIPPSSINPELDRSWDTFISKAMAKKPEDRFEEAHSMADEIKTVFDRYIKNKKKECLAGNFVDLSGAPQKKPTEPSPLLRSYPEKVKAQRARKMFDLDSLERPTTYHISQTELMNPHVVVDHSTALAWQQRGSFYPMNYNAAGEYIKKLRREEFGGFKDWRLPTINELLTLLHPPPPDENFCLEKLFSTAQNCLWSSDNRSFKASWLVNSELGFVFSSDILDYFYVKAVCTIKEEHNLVEKPV